MNKYGRSWDQNLVLNEKVSALKLYVHCMDSKVLVLHIDTISRHVWSILGLKAVKLILTYGYDQTRTTRDESSMNMF